MLLKAGFVLLLPLTLLLTVESIYRGDFGGTVYWLSHFPSQFFVNYVLLFGVVNIFYFLHRKAYLSIYLFLISFFSVFGYISHEKLVLRGQPLLPWDLVLGQEAENITSDFSSLIPIKGLIIAAIILAVLIVGIIFVPKEKFEVKFQKENKYLIAIVALVAFIAFYTEYIPLGKTFGVRLINWDQKWNYDENGFILGFSLNSKSLNVKKPANYDKQSVQEVMNKHKNTNPVDKSFKPNVIFIQSEAFFDPTVMKNVKFSQDPIPFYHSLEQTQTHGIMYSPVYGGGTVNTEFEILTGMSTQFMPPGMMPFAQYVNKPLDSLARIFNRQGYTSTGVHTYDGWFYSRDKVYQDFGFDKFVSKETFLNPATKRLGFLADSELSNRILNEVKDTNGPDFVYGVSMENHGPYAKSDNPINTIKVSGSLSQNSKDILETYSQNLIDVDNSLKQLITGLEETKEPTIVVFYGDHLPMLGDNYQVYKEAGYFDNDSTYSKYQSMHGVPFVIWDNFSHQKQTISTSATFMGSYVLKLAEKQGNALTDFLTTEAEKDSSVVTRPDYWKNEKMNQSDLNDYQLLQYDMLFGKGYANQVPITENKNYQRVDKIPVITGTNPVEVTHGKLFNPYKNQSVIGVTGENFTLGSQIFMNGQPLTTTVNSENYVTAIVPKNFYSSQGTLEIQVNVTDTMRNVLSKSNTLKVKVK